MVNVDLLRVVDKYTLSNGRNYNLVSSAAGFTRDETDKVMHEVVGKIQERRPMGLFYHEDLLLWVIEDEVMPLVEAAFSLKVQQQEEYSVAAEQTGRLKQELLAKVNPASWEAGYEQV